MKTNILKRTLAGVLAVLCVAGSLPANVDGGGLFDTAIVASAEYTEGSLTIGNVSVAGTTTNGAGWSFDASKNELTLNNANITYSDNDVIKYTGTEALKIVLNGDNNLTGKRGIYAQSAEVNISGTGSLTIEATSTGITGKGITFDSCTVNIMAGGYFGVYSAPDSSGSTNYNNITINNATLNVTANSTGYAFALCGKIINTIPGKVWTDVNGTENETDVPVNNVGVEYYKTKIGDTEYTYKKAQFIPLTYMDWNDTSKQLVQTTLPDGAEPITVTTDTSTSWNGGENGAWYVVSANTTINKRITVNGTVNLILKDGVTLDATKGITVTNGNTLNIYGQRLGTGVLNVPATEGAVDVGNAGIGGNGGHNGGNVTINGGIVTVKGGSNAPGIGRGNGASGDSGTVTINGGTVTVTGGYYGAGIGGGTGGNGVDVIINGGTVTATGGERAAGIGGGSSASEQGTVTINNGLTVKADNSQNPPTTNVSVTDYQQSHTQRYVKIGYPEVAASEPLVIKDGSKFTVNGAVEKIGETDTNVTSGELFTVTATETGLKISANGLNSDYELTFGKNSAKTYLASLSGETLTFTENKVYSSKVSDRNALNIGDVLAPGAEISQPTNNANEFQNYGLSGYSSSSALTPNYTITSEGAKKDDTTIMFAEGMNAFVLVKKTGDTYRFNQTHIDLGARVETPPKAVTGLTYDGDEHELIDSQNKGAASEGATLKYSTPNAESRIIEQTAGQSLQLEIDDIKIGNIYKATDANGICFPGDYKVKFGEKTLQMYNGSTPVKLFKVNDGKYQLYGGKENNQEYGDSIDLTSGNDALRIKSINKDDKLIGCQHRKESECHSATKPACKL